MQMNITNMEQQAYGRDQELMNAILKLQAGDAAAFDTIYLHTNRFMFQKAGQILASYHNKDSELRNDMVQDAYIKIFNNISSLQEPSRFYGWINTILVNTIYAYTRAHWREAFDVVDEEGDSMVEGICHDTDTPEARILEKEKIDYINSALDTLPPLQRYTVEFYYYSEMSVEDIAKTMDCSEGTVKSRLNYARQKLKGAIEEIERTKKIKIYSIFALPALLFAAKEEALVSVTAVDAASFASVREALHRECILKATAPAGGNNMNNEYSNNNAINNNYTQANPQTQIPPQPQGTIGVPVSSVSTSIFKTAVGKIIIAITAVLVTVGVIMGGYFIFGDGDKEDTPAEEEITGNEGKGENADNVDTEEPADNVDTEEPDEEPSLVDEDGYIHVGSDDLAGTPNRNVYKPHEDLPFYTEVRNTYFPTGTESAVELGYTSDYLDDYATYLSKVDIRGAYKIDKWDEALIIDGITYDDFVNSGAEGLYFDGSTVTIYVDILPESSDLLWLLSVYQTEGSGGFKVMTIPQSAEDLYASGEREIGECFTQSYWVNMYMYDEDEDDVIATCGISGDAYAFRYSYSEWFAGDYSNYTSDIDLQKTRKSSPFAGLRLTGHYGYMASNSINFDDEIPDFVKDYVYELEYSQEYPEYNYLSDPNNISGKALGMQKQMNSLYFNHYASLYEQFETAETLIDKYSFMQQIYEPVMVNLYDEEFRLFVYDAYWGSNEENAYGDLYAYIVPTGVKVEMETADVTEFIMIKEKEPVVIPEVTLVPVAYYDRESGLSGLQSMDEQVNEVLDILQMEIDAEVTTEEQGEAIRNILWKTRELYFIVCADNGSMKNYSDIGNNAWLAPFGLADFTEIIEYYEETADFKHYVNIYMGDHTGCVDDRLQSIKDSLSVVSGAELTKTQQVAMHLSKELLDVFYVHRGNFEKVIDAYAERAGRTYDEDLEYYRQLTDYDSRMEEITAYRELIAEVPNWTFE